MHYKEAWNIQPLGNSPKVFRLYDLWYANHILSTSFRLLCRDRVLNSSHPLERGQKCWIHPHLQNENDGSSSWNWPYPHSTDEGVSPILLTCLGWCSSSYKTCPTLDVPWMYLGSLQGTFWRSCCITWNIFTNILMNNCWLHFDWHKLQKYALIGQWWLVHSVV